MPENGICENEKQKSDSWKNEEMIHRKMKNMPCWNIDLYENDITQWGKD